MRLQAGLRLGVATLLTVACDEAKVQFALQVVTAGAGSGTVRTVPTPEIDCGGLCAAVFDTGSSVSLAAAPGSGSVFAGWSGDCAGTERCDLAMDGPKRATATFDKKTFQLTVTSSGSGTGSVTSDPAGISCGTRCSQTFAFGARVALEAKADVGSVFTGWAGACSGNGACVVSLTEARSVQAGFVLDRRRLTVQAAGIGSVVSTPAGIDCGPSCAAEFQRFSFVSLAATASTGWTHQGWSGDCAGAGACRVTLDAHRSVTAHFVRSSATLSVRFEGDGAGLVASGDGQLQCPGRCATTEPLGTLVRLTASPVPGSVFEGYSGVCSGTAVCDVTLTGDQEVVARFTLRRNTLTVRTKGAGSGHVRSDPAGIDCPTTCTLQTTGAETIELLATADAGSELVAWSGGCNGVGRCQPTLDRDRTVTARFERVRHPVSVVVRSGVRVRSVPPGIDCPGQCSTRVDHGDAIALTAEPYAGSELVGWSRPCGDDPACTVTVVAPLTVEPTARARYVLVPAGVGTIGSPAGEPGRDPDEGPVRQITLVSSFWLRATEVTRAEWRTVMGSEPLAEPACGQDCPVVSITWDEAVDYVNERSRIEGRQRCYTGPPGDRAFVGVHCGGYRLPTEAEWELAAGGNQAFEPSPACTLDPALETQGWYCNNAGGRVQSVASKAPNDLGIYDMFGNAAEWTNDWYVLDHYSTSTAAVDPVGPSSGAGRVVRGGSFADLPRHCRPSARRGAPAGQRTLQRGLRPVRSVWVRVQPGVFAMGSSPSSLGHRADEAPRHRVSISTTMEIAATELTTGGYRALTGEVRPEMCADSCAAEGLSWDDVGAYIAQRRLHDPQVRLPTEAEWARAARAGSQGPLTSGPLVDIACADPGLSELGWYCGTAAGHVEAVAQLAPNAWGLHDVHGNVAEWVSDHYAADYYASAPSRDPAGPVAGSERVFRGGHYDDDARACRLSSRGAAVPGTTAHLGVRLARDVCGPEAATSLPFLGAPLGRLGAHLAWTGAELIVWGGAGQTTGARLDPAAGLWRAMPAAGAPSARLGSIATFSGDELLVWGGAGGGAAYRPVTNTWRPIVQGPLQLRLHAAHTFTGTEWVIVHGREASAALADGARFIPATGEWIDMADSPLAPRSEAAALWTGRRVLVGFGVDGAGQALNDAAFYDPVDDSWSAVSVVPGCAGAATAHRAGSHGVFVSTGGWCRLDFESSGWQAVAPRPAGRTMSVRSIAASTGADIVVYGGSSDLSDAVVDVYDPLANTWHSRAETPGLALGDANAVWTGCAMMFWSAAGGDGLGYAITP